MTQTSSHSSVELADGIGWSPDISNVRHSESSHIEHSPHRYRLKNEPLIRVYFVRRFFVWY